MKKNKFPLGWDEERVKKVLAHYEEQSEEEALAEDEEAYEDIHYTFMEIPIEIVPEVRELIAHHKSSTVKSSRQNIIKSKENLKN